MGYVIASNQLDNYCPFVPYPLLTKNLAFENDDCIASVRNTMLAMYLRLRRCLEEQ